MPTVLRIGAYRFFFYSNEKGEPRHIHICPISCDHIPHRSWAFFQAREVMRNVVESFKQEQST